MMTSSQKSKIFGKFLGFFRVFYQNFPRNPKFSQKFKIFGKFLGFFRVFYHGFFDTARLYVHQERKVTQ